MKPDIATRMKQHDFKGAAMHILRIVSKLIGAGNNKTKLLILLMLYIFDITVY